MRKPALCSSWKHAYIGGSSRSDGGDICPTRRPTTPRETSRSPGRFQKRELNEVELLREQVKPHLKRQWCLAEINAKFLWQMEHVLALYARTYDPKRPLVCFDERPCFLIGDVVVPLPASNGKPKREDYHYSKHGSCAVLMAFEPHMGRRWAKVYDRRTAKEYTQFMQHLSEQFPEAEVIELVQDNLSTHQGGSFYAHLSAAEAFALGERFTMHFTPKGASWLNMIELEFSVLSRQCLERRIPCQQLLEREVLT